jgi:Raf kinase inhibitor-like YbhB/YbcL family protein
MTMKLHSPAFSDGDVIPARFTCDGDNLSPPLAWSGAPKGTKGFAIVCDDSDAPGGTFLHWGVWDIPARWNSLDEGASPIARDVGPLEALNEFRHQGYGGPCPPPERGAHRYHFHLWALPVERLKLPPHATCADLKREARKQALAEAVLMGVYER